MKNSPGVNKNIISNKRVFIGRFSLYSLWTDVSEDLPSFVKVQRDNEGRSKDVKKNIYLYIYKNQLNDLTIREVCLFASSIETHSLVDFLLKFYNSASLGKKIFTISPPFAFDY